MKTFKGYGITGINARGKKFLLLSSIDYNRNSCISQFIRVKTGNESWKEYRKNGYRCVVLKIQEQSK